MSVADLVCDDFAAHVGSVFALVGQEGTTLPLTLVEAKPACGDPRGGGRAPFSLLFRSSVQQVVPQGLYRFEHDAMGTIDLGITPVARTADGIDYEAAFN